MRGSFPTDEAAQLEGSFFVWKRTAALDDFRLLDEARNIS